MTLTAVGEVSIGGALPCAVAATGAVTAAVAVELPRLQANLAGYLELQANPLVIAPDIVTQLAGATSAMASAMAELVATGPVGVTLAGTLTAAVAAQVAAQLAIAGAYPSISAKIDAALAAIGAMNVQITAGVSGANVNLLVIASEIAELAASVGTLEAQASLAASISASLTVGGLRLYRFDGSVSELGGIGAQLQSMVTAAVGADAQIHFMFVLPTNAGAWTALQATVKTS